jgi:hypothetical protein
VSAPDGKTWREEVQERLAPHIKPDPNGDLIGKSFTYADGWVYTVTETADWSDQYVWGDCHNPENGHTVPKVTKPVGLVRQRIRRDEIQAKIRFE